MMKFSPTTILGYVTALGICAIVAHPLYLYWTVDNYNALVGLAGANALALAFLGVMAVAKGHVTADNPPNPKAND